MKLKLGDTVKIIAGREKGKFGKITQINKSSNKVIVEGLNLNLKHQKPATREESGSIIQKEAPIHSSNVMLCDSNNIASRIKIIKVQKNTERVSRKTGEKI